MIDYKLHSRYVINMKMIPQSPIHIGTGEGGFMKSIVFINVSGNPLPIIPAESVKGVLRSIAARIAGSMKFNTAMYGLNVDDIVKNHKKDIHTDYVNKLLNENRKEELTGKIKEVLKNIKLSEKHINNIVEELGLKEALELAVSLLCPICLLFGSRYYSGKILITDAIPVNLNGNPTSPKMEMQTCTSISRICRTVEAGRLYTVQYIVPDNIVYKLRMVIDNVVKGDVEAKLLGNLLKYIGEHGIIIGGLKSRGFGHMKIDMEILKMKFTKPKDKNDLNTIINNIKALLVREEAVEKLTADQIG